MWWQVFLGVSGSIILGYCFLLFMMGWRFRKLPTHAITEDEPAITATVSIIVPFRNEMDTLTECVDSLINASRGLKDFQIILVDDHSNDGSQKIAASLSDEDDRIELMMSKGEGKKRALATGIEAARFDWIFTADADCNYPAACITHLLINVVEEELDVGTLPVVSQHSGNLLQAYDNLESHGIQVTTAVALDTNLFLSASGAAILYPKSLYQKLQPYQENGHIPSGDDQFFLYAYRKVNNEKIFFLKHPTQVVTTRPAESWKVLLHQRLRWAGKSSELNDRTLSGILALNMAAEGLMILLLVSIFIKNSILFCALILWLLKMSAEVFLLTSGNQFWKHTKSLKYLPLVTLIRPFFQATLFIFYITGTRNYWKGRLISRE